MSAAYLRKCIFRNYFTEIFPHVTSSFCLVFVIWFCIPNCLSTKVDLIAKQNACDVRSWNRRSMHFSSS